MGRGGGALKGMMARSWSWGMEVLCARAASEEIRRERFALEACMLGMGFGCEGGSEGDDLGKVSK